MTAALDLLEDVLEDVLPVDATDEDAVEGEDEAALELSCWVAVGVEVDTGPKGFVVVLAAAVNMSNSAVIS